MQRIIDLYLHISEDSYFILKEGGGRGFAPDFCEEIILRYELAMMARTCTKNFRAVLSPYVQHCQCEALEQKLGPKSKILSKEIELSFFIPID